MVSQKSYCTCEFGSSERNEPNSFGCESSESEVQKERERERRRRRVMERAETRRGEGEERRQGGGESYRMVGESSSGLIGRSSNRAEPVWPTIDGPLGLTEEDALSYARSFFKFGFCLLPWLWAVNCFYFWPILTHSHSFTRLRPYVMGSAIGFTAFTLLISSWAFTFAIGGEHLFGSIWQRLVMYNVADRFGLLRIGRTVARRYLLLSRKGLG